MRRFSSQAAPSCGHDFWRQSGHCFWYWAPERSHLISSPIVGRAAWQTLTTVLWQRVAARSCWVLWLLTKTHEAVCCSEWVGSVACSLWVTDKDAKQTRNPEDSSSSFDWGVRSDRMPLIFTGREWTGYFFLSFLFLSSHFLPPTPFLSYLSFLFLFFSVFVVLGIKPSTDSCVLLSPLITFFLLELQNHGIPSSFLFWIFLSG